MTEDSTYITPTKERPIFKCHNDYFGYIEQEFYKDFEIKNEQVWIIGSTFATSLTDAIVRCHDFIKEHPETNPKSKFIIEMVDGNKSTKYILQILVQVQELYILALDRILFGFRALLLIYTFVIQLLLLSFHSFHQMFEQRIRSRYAFFVSLLVLFTDVLSL